MLKKSKEENGKYKITIGKRNNFIQEEELVVITPPQKLKKEDQKTSGSPYKVQTYLLSTKVIDTIKLLCTLKFMTDLQTKHKFGKSETEMTAFDYISKQLHMLSHTKVLRKS